MRRLIRGDDYNPHPHPTLPLKGRDRLSTRESVLSKLNLGRSYRIRYADWTRDGARLRAVREAVFVREQGVPQELELDEFDALAHHVLAESGDGSAVGTARLLADGHIGRMAVLRDWRGCGIGSGLLGALLEQARSLRMPQVVLYAQTHALPFYARHGFVAEGAVFVEAGIPHQVMLYAPLRRDLKTGEG